ncbi:hypothetical protein ES703_84221 [subsurface metagenome]
MKKIKKLNSKYKFKKSLSEMEMRSLATIIKKIQELGSNIVSEKEKIRMAEKRIEQYKDEILKKEQELMKLEIKKT